MRSVASYIVYFLLSAVVLQSFAIPIIFMGFKLNQDYIAAELCENREIPESGCGGQCYLMKKLKKAQDEQQGTEGHTVKKENIVQFITALKKASPLLPLQEILLSREVFSSLLSPGIQAIFHPPEIDKTLTLS